MSEQELNTCKKCNSKHAGNGDMCGICQDSIISILLASCKNAVKQMQDKPVQAQGEWEQGLMCGLEDMDLTDRYVVCRHGYDKALDKVQEWIIDEIEAAIAKTLDEPLGKTMADCLDKMLNITIKPRTA